MMSLTGSISPTVDPRKVKEERLRRKARRNFTLFKHLVFRGYEHADHLEVLDRKLEQVARYIETGGREGIGRLIIEMPPRHGKTFTISRLFPAWIIGRFPDWRVMNVSYGATLAYRNSRAARNYMRSANYRAIFPGVTLAQDSRAVDTWSVEGHEGGMDALGIGGGATGKGAQLLIIDDPIKNRAEAESALIREKVWESYTNDLYTRLEPGGAVIIVQTRWHQDDLTGRVLAESEKDDSDDPEPWERLRMPAIAGENDPLGRQPGEALWPWRYPLERLTRIMRAVGRYAWGSLYQQDPRPREGGIFKYADIDNHRVKVAPELVRVTINVDPSGGAGGDHDEVGITVTGASADRHAYVLADASKSASAGDWASTVIGLYQKYNADAVVVEKNFGGDMAQALIRTVAQNIGAGYINIKEVTASRGKAVRAEPIAALYEDGRVHHVGTFPVLEDEMTTWKPGGQSPNRMDALVWGVTELIVDPQQVTVTDAPAILSDWRGG